MKRELIHIDSLTSICGYFNTNSHIYSGYCCDHEDCGEARLVQKIKGEWQYPIKKFYRETDLIAEKMTTRNIRCNRRLAKKFIKRAKKLDYKDYPKYGFKMQGGCFDFSCPLARQAEEEDFINHGEDPDYMSQGGWLVIDSEMLQDLESLDRKLEYNKSRPIKHGKRY